MHEANTCTADQTVPRKFLLQTVAVQVEKYMLSSESKLIVAADAVEIWLVVTWELSYA